MLKILAVNSDFGSESGSEISKMDKMDDEDDKTELRKAVGSNLQYFRNQIDENIILFRYVCLGVIATSIGIVLKQSKRMSTRIGQLSDISPSMYSKKKKLIGRIVQQQGELYYFSHTPWLRRWIWQDSVQNRIKIRQYGIHVEQPVNLKPDAWVTFELLGKEPNADVAVGFLFQNQFFRRRKDHAASLLLQGKAEIRNENPPQHCSTNAVDLQYLTSQMTQYERYQAVAQRNRRGIWTAWQEDKVGDRLYSASIRASKSVWERIKNKLRS